MDVTHYPSGPSDLRLTFELSECDESARMHSRRTSTTLHIDQTALLQLKPEQSPLHTKKQIQKTAPSSDHLTSFTDHRHLSRSPQRNTSLCQSKTSRPSVSDLAATAPPSHPLTAMPHHTATQSRKTRVPVLGLKSDGRKDSLTEVEYRPKITILCFCEASVMVGYP